MKKYRRPSIIRFRSARSGTKNSHWYGEWSGRYPSGKKFLAKILTPAKRSRSLTLSPEGFFDYAVRWRKKRYGR